LNIELGQVIKKVLLSPNSTKSCKVSFLLTECVRDNNAAHVKNRDFKTLCLGKWNNSLECSFYLEFVA